MGKKNIFVVGGSSGIGLEIVNKLEDNQNEVIVGSRKAPRSLQSQTILVFLSPLTLKALPPMK